MSLRDFRLVLFSAHYKQINSSIQDNAAPLELGEHSGVVSRGLLLAQTSSCYPTAR